jgi:cytochrome c-type biogenesis protein CcmH
MILFWLICAGLTAIALAFVLPTLLQREPSDNAVDKERANVDVYRDQLRELEADLVNGLVSKEQYGQDRTEIERRLLEDVVKQPPVTKHKGAKSNRVVYAVALAVPVGAVGLYLLVGNPRAASGSLPPAVTSDGQMTQAGIEANVAALAKRLEQTPDDADGWAMLGRSYLNLEKYKEASDAYARATAIKTEDADLLTEYAFVLAMSNNRQLQGKPTELIQRALQIAPENPKALELAGSASFQAKDYKQAIVYWQKVLEKAGADSELGRSVAQRIDEAKKLAATP